MARGSRNYCHREVLPFAAMVVAGCATVGSNTVYKAAVSKGLSYHIFMLYTYAIAALALLPLSYFFHRKTKLPPLTIGIVLKFFSLGVLGFVAQYLGNLGIALSSPTLGSAMSSLTPAATFILAILFRMEKIEIGSSSSHAKIIGTVLSIAGAIIVVLFKGPALITSRVHESAPMFISLHDHQVSVQSNWIAGGVVLAAEYIIASIWYTYQAKVIKEYPAEIVLVLFYNISCSIISLVDCLITEPNFDAWKLKPDVRLISILYAGTLGTGLLTILIHTWGIHVKGPVYVALFMPMSIAIAAIMGLILLGDTLYLGCVIGSIIISAGFYTVVWGKAKEEAGDKSQVYADVESLPSNSTAPLLPQHAAT
ncbi:wat1-related protein at5g40240 [Phtheirospermum japonicum]|uniref:WAT1-related protein n=1 Tax=Phtheirospermum japonicum TaxID=374723 RepID=A0A830D777_9LAMI|nr:wat1-related protein at5g40240 [Phtheirospermum japonicum]